MPRSPAYIPPKPTEYRGRLFRSRLEASWALWFDAIGWSWTYEPKPLIDDYVPDFLLFVRPPPEVGDSALYVEVKGERYGDQVQVHRADLDRWDDHLRAADPVPLLLLIGRPGIWNSGQLDQPRLNAAARIFRIDAGTGAMEAENVWLTGCDRCGDVGLAPIGQLLSCSCQNERWRSMPRRMADAAKTVRAMDWHGRSEAELYGTDDDVVDRGDFPV